MVVEALPAWWPGGCLDGLYKTPSSLFSVSHPFQLSLEGRLNLFDTIGGVSDIRLGSLYIQRAIVHP